MKRLIISTLLVILGFSVNAQWTQVSVNETNALYSVHIAGNKIAIGGAGKTVTSNDGGANWTSYPVVNLSGNSLACGQMYAVHFFDQNTGITTGVVSMGNSETVLRTTNGGANWAAVNVYNLGSLLRYLDDLHFPTSTIGYACGSNGRILKTTDAGQNWSFVGTGSTLWKSIWFTSSTTGFVVGNNTILKTTNSGSSWTTTSVSGNLTSVTFGDANTGFASGDGVIYKTTDAGATWLPVTESFTTTGAVFATDANTVYLAANNGLYVTRNGGQYWECFTDLNNVSINDIYFDNLNYGYVVGDNGKVYKTLNGGGNTAPISYFTASPSMYCPDSLIQFTNAGPGSYTYLWLFNGNPFSTSLNTSYIFTNPAQTDTISLISSNGILTDTFNMNISVLVSPNINLPINLVQDSVCPGSSASFQVLNSVSGVTYRLRNGIVNIGSSQNGNGGTLTFSTGAVSNTTVFNIYATRTTTCGFGENTAFDTVTVFKVDPNVQVWPLKPAICDGQLNQVLIYPSQIGVSYCLKSGSSYFGSWCAGNGDTLFMPAPVLTTSVTYKVEGHNYLGCTNVLLVQTCPVIVKHPDADVTFSTNGVFLGDTVGLQNISADADTYQWVFGQGSSVPTDTSEIPILTYSTTGHKTIKLTVYSNAGCSATGSYFIDIFDQAAPGAGDTCFLKTIAGIQPVFVTDMKCDAAKNIYFTGYMTSNATFNHYRMITAKLDSVGDVLWMRYEPSGTYSYNESSYGTGIALDSAGNAYVSGHYYGDRMDFGSQQVYSGFGKYIAYVCRFSPVGDLDWVTHIRTNINYEQDVFCSDVEVGLDGKVYISGTMELGNTPVIITFPDNTTWQRIGTPSYYDEFLLSLTTGGTLDTIEFFGLSAGSGNVTSTHYVSLSYNPYTEISCNPKMVMSDNGDLILTTTYWGLTGSSTNPITITGGPVSLNAKVRDGILMRYRPGTGFIQAFVTTGYATYSIYNIDDDDNVYMSGSASRAMSFGASMINPDTTYYGSDVPFPYLCKLDSAGNALWIIKGMNYTAGYIQPYDTVVYVMASISGYGGLGDVQEPQAVISDSIQDIVIASYTPDGNLIGIRKIEGNKTATACMGAADQCGDLVLAMYELTSGWDKFLHLARFAPDSYCNKSNCIPQLYQDAALISIDHPGSIIGPDPDSLVVTFRNTGAFTLNDLDISWSLDNGTASTYHWNGILPVQHALYELNIGSINLSAGSHELKVWVSNPNMDTDAVQTNDTLVIYVYRCNGPLAGDYIIGESPSDFPSVSLAADALSSCGIIGNVNMLIKDGIYYENIVQRAIPGSSSTQRVVFTSQSMDSTAVEIITSSDPALKLDGATYMQYDHLSFRSSNTCDPISTLITITSLSSDIRFNNNIFSGVIMTGGVMEQTLVHADGTPAMDSLSFISNRFLNGTVGIYLDGYGTQPYASGYLLQDNNFINNLSTAIDIGSSAGMIIKGNRISGTATGINIYRVNSSPRILGNNINYAGIGIYIYGFDGTSLLSALIANNMVSSEAQSIYINGCDYVNLYHNTFYGHGSSVSVVQLGNDVHNFNLKNNIITNISTGKCVLIDGHYPIQNPWDYNLLYTAGSIFGYEGYGNITDFTTWQAIGLDLHSLNYQPLIITPGDLHVYDEAIIMNHGTPLADVPLDYDGEPRDTVNPDPGADETSILPDYSAVWPGDADANNVVDGTDIFPLGLYYNAFGTCRINAINSWTASAAVQWPDTIYNGKNLNNADCNGNGIINEGDTLAIIQNFGLSHSKKSETEDPAKVLVDFCLVPDQNIYAPGDTAWMSIYAGNSGNSVVGLSGYAADIFVSATCAAEDFIQSTWINGIMGLKGRNLGLFIPQTISTTLTLAMVRKDDGDTTAYGLLNRFGLVISDTITQDIIVDVSFNDLTAIDRFGQPLQFLTCDTSFLVHISTISIRDEGCTSIQIYPNPGNGRFLLGFKPEIPGEVSIKVRDLSGRLVFTKELGKISGYHSEMINLAGLESGIYNLVLEMPDALVTRKLIIVR